MVELKGKVALVTGAAMGMGKLEALNFAGEGCRVAIADVNKERLAETLEEFNQKGYEAYSYILDVTDREACLRVAEEVKNDIGPIDILVNNAGVVECGDFLQMSEKSLRWMFDVNVFGQAWMMQAVLPDMVRRGKGYVVNVCSSAGKVGVARMAGYCSTKFAGIGLTDTVRAELRGSGVTFIIVNPGFVQTGMFEGAKIPFFTRWIQPQEVADAMLKAIKKNNWEVFIPNFAVRMAALSRGLGLPKISDWALTVMGGNKSMTEWRGH
ncbi:MAG TPA: SDR family NAD(P)-dependent oxidoreductase [Candidatus Anoxymicrobiaceae bacterium]